ncbi:MAG: hypothetical protein AABZ17_14730 [Nitrospirota bacterium]
MDNAKKKEPGWLDDEFLAITLSALAIEAIYNAVGERVVNGWRDFESCNPTVKARIVCTRLHIEYDSSREPWATLLWLSKFRNLIAHPKAETIAESKVVSKQEHEQGTHRTAPKSKLEKRVSLQNAEKAIKAVDAALSLFCEKLSVEDRFGISGDMWSVSSRRQDGG